MAARPEKPIKGGQAGACFRPPDSCAPSCPFVCQELHGRGGATVAADDIGRDRQARDEALRTGFRFLLGKASRAAYKRESREPGVVGGAALGLAASRGEAEWDARAPSFLPCVWRRHLSFFSPPPFVGLAEGERTSVVVALRRFEAAAHSLG